jgi:biopolymer transport protein ExbD
VAVKINKGNVGGIDFTPILDMVFNLLIFFMVTSEFAKEDRELRVALASASEARPLTAQAEDIFINIDKQGRFFVDSRIMAADEVEAFLRQKVADNPASLSVKVRPDGQGIVQPTVTAFDICARAGVKDVSIVTEGPSN